MMINQAKELFGQARDAALYIGYVVVLGSAFLALFTIWHASAHDFLLNGTRSPTGEWCCGAEDCGEMSPGSLHPMKGGYSVRGTVTYGASVTGNEADGPTRTETVNEFWPYADVMPSPDGKTWRCKRPDGSPRCKFTSKPES